MGYARLLHRNRNHRKKWVRERQNKCDRETKRLRSLFRRGQHLSAYDTWVSGSPLVAFVGRDRISGHGRRVLLVAEKKNGGALIVNCTES
jgi:hypothetical protein